MIRTALHPTGLLVLTACMMLTGCLDRKETITVDPGGTVSIVATFDTKSASELHDGDVMPSVAAGWLLEQTADRDAEGEIRHHLRAEMILPAGVAFPTSFAAPGDPDAGRVLQFPTTLSIEDRGDETHYRFHRVYTARRWAPLGLLRRRLVDEPLEALKDHDEAELNAAQYRLIIEAFADYEIAKWRVFARRAFREVFPGERHDCWLVVNAALDRSRHELDTERLVDLVAGGDRPREHFVEQQAALWESEARRRMESAIEEFCGVGAAARGEFMRHFDGHRRELEITDDLGDDTFEITIDMPGRIVAANADRVEGNRAVWRFKGERMRDADYELMVISVSANDP